MGGPETRKDGGCRACPCRLCTSALAFLGRSLPQMAALEGCWILKQVRQSLGEGWISPGIEEVPTGFLWRSHGAEPMSQFYCFWESKCKRPGFNSWVGRIPWRRKWQPTPVFLPGEFHGCRGLVGYSPWSRKESDTIERLHFIVNGRLKGT